MKTMFEPSGFRGANLFVDHHGPQLGNPVRVRMGDAVNQGERDRLLTIIKQGTGRMAAVRKWIASKIDQDPMLYNTFRDRVVADNFWSYDDMVVGDQWAVDAANQALSSSDPSTWNLSPEIVQRVGDWGAGVDIMYAGMQQYGGAGGMVKMGPTGPTGVTSPTGAGGLLSPAPGGGLSTGQVIVGGAVLVAAGLVISSLF